ncbi:hypothetical protein [Ornithinimicrobium ciconiae]|nr:hypothetical protein [Ornithinimicrobium ciconiae]
MSESHPLSAVCREAGFPFWGPGLTAYLLVVPLRQAGARSLHPDE